MSDKSVQLSLKLWDVLEKMGVSERIRKVYRDTSFQMELVPTLIYQMTGNNFSVYKFGSSCEGTTTPGMGSDVDIVVCDESIPVIEDVKDAPLGTSYLVVTDTHTQPGYVKLQILTDGEQLNKQNSFNVVKSHESYDCNDRYCKKPTTSLGGSAFVNKRSGPADNVENAFSPDEDYVSAVRCRTFPLMATSSMEKCIACGWMSKDDIEKIKRFGCLLVGVGHPSSKEADLEWRVSFSLQERQLMLALNQTQQACYVLLKLVKQFITEKLKMEEKDNFITSYHCKTCLFSVIAHTRPVLWTSENLIKCTCICLSELTDWISKGNCPNFFINENNMFDRQAFVDVQERLLYHMRCILNEWPNIFYQIDTDQIGETLRGTARDDIDQKLSKRIDEILLQVEKLTWLCQFRFLKHCEDLQTTQQTIAEFLNEQLQYLDSVDMINEHSREDTNTAVKRVQYVLNKLSALHLASLAFDSNDLESCRTLLQESRRHQAEVRKVDPLSSRLIEATVLLLSGHAQSCCDTLKDAERHLNEAPEQLCECNQDHSQTVISEHLRKGVCPRNLDPTCITPTCMMFLPWQSNIIPIPLQYEMYRSVHTPPTSRYKTVDKWYDWAVVDCKIYLRLLQFIANTLLERPVAVQKAVIDMLNAITYDPNISHRETGYNLLGWMYSPERLKNNAAKCFLKSWMLKPDHNAAKWHMLILIYKRYIAKQ